MLRQPLFLNSELLGAMLAQKNLDDGKESTIYYMSKTFTMSEMSYSEAEKTCVALVYDWSRYCIDYASIHCTTKRFQ